MKVIFDCTALSSWTGHPTGIQRVVAGLGSELPKLLPNSRLGLFTGNGTCLEYSLEARSAGVEISLERGDLIISAGTNWDLPDHHGELLSLALGGMKLGFLFHDTIPILLPFSYGPGFAAIYEKWLRESINAAAIAFANSENTRCDLLSYGRKGGLRVPPVHTLRLGDDIPASTDPPSGGIQLRCDQPFILSVGTLEYRKNHIVLLNSYRYMIDELGYTPPKLYIVGKRGWLDGDVEYQVANDIRLNGIVEVLQGLSDADLRHLYQSAMFTVYPSVYEGWGLPVAESLCYGKQCIASRTSSMLEIAPGLTRFAHPLLVSEWVQQIRELADDPALLAAETARVASGYKPTRWAQTAEQMAHAIASEFPEFGQ